MTAKLAIIVAGVITSLVGFSAVRQRVDWVELFRQVASRDSATRDAARQKFFNLGADFWNADADVLTKDVQAMLPAFDEKDGQVRLQASAVISALSLGRQDGTIVLDPAVHVLLAHFKDPETMVRRNAVSAIINLKPEIPANALEHLLPMPGDADIETAEAATYGITRLALKSPAALRSLRDLMTGKDVPLRVKQAAVETIGAWLKSDNPEIVALLALALEDKNRTLVLWAIRAATRLGSLAESLRPQLEKLSDENVDPQVQTAAAAALERLRNSK